MDTNKGGHAAHIYPHTKGNLFVTIKSNTTTTTTEKGKSGFP